MNYAIGIILPLILTALLIMLFRPVALRIGLVDVPGDRKHHEGSIPLVGGLGIFCAFLFSVLVFDVPANTLRPLFAASALLLIVGVLDDLHELQVRDRFIAQIGAILLVVLWGGVSLQTLGNLLGPGAISLGLIAIPFSVFSAVGVMNSLNMIDGIDGLSSGILLILLGFLGTTLWEHGYTAELQLVLILFGCMVAFFVFNFVIRSHGRAFTFLGDSGTLFLGIVIASWLIQYSQAPYNLYRPVTALWLFAVPIIDTVSIMGRRVLRGESPFEPDRWHLHHMLQRHGLGIRATTLLILCLQFILTIVGMLGESYSIPEYLMFYSFLALFAFYNLSMRWVERMPQAGSSEVGSMVNKDAAR